MYRVIMAAFVVLGTVVAINGGYGLRRAKRFRRDVTEWVPVQAVVVDHRPGLVGTDGERVTVHHHVVRYRDLGGREQTGTTIDGNSWTKQPPGSFLQVRYDPRDPGRVVTGDGGRASGLGTFVSVTHVVLGSLFAVVGIAGLALGSVL